MVIVTIHIERFPLETVSQLHSQCTCPIRVLYEILASLRVTKHEFTTSHQRVIIMIGMSHKTHVYNIALERVIIIISVSHEIQIHNIALESNYYD